MFVQEFLRVQKRKDKRVRIGSTIREVRGNLREAILAKTVAPGSLEIWLNNIEGWGKQHLYLTRLPKRSLSQPHLLNKTSLTTFLRKRDFWKEHEGAEAGASVRALTDVAVDDELARITWRVHGSDWERREELDEVRELDDGEYEFRAYRRLLKRSASRVLIRKTDGVVLLLIDVPLGDDHVKLKAQIDEVTNKVVAPLTREVVGIGAIVSALDSGAVEGFGPKPKRKLDIGVAPTQARYRAEGARVEFTSTRESAGYTDSDPVRRMRKAMQIEKFVSEAGKFRLKFEGKERREHDMVVSFSATDNRAYLYSRMDEDEVLSLVDHLLLI
jgi:hypothetical protein